MNAAIKPGPVLRPRGALAVTGSKGGVGKSNLVLNLAVALGRWGRRVLLVDGDLGLANIDVLLGLMPQQTVEHLLCDEGKLEDVLIDGPEGVRVLPAASGVPRLARMDADLRGRLLSSLSDCTGEMDDVLVDTGAGLNDTNITLQLAASQVLLVTTPEPTSLVDAYATLKVLWSADPDKSVEIVVNAAQDDDEAERAYEQIARAAQHFLGAEPGLAGVVYHDERVREAVRRQVPLMTLYPDSVAARCYERIALRLASASTESRPGEMTDYWRRLELPLEREMQH